VTAGRRAGEKATARTNTYNLPLFALLLALPHCSFGCEVTAHFVEEKTVFLVKFHKDVMQREAAFEQAGR